MSIDLCVDLKPAILHFLRRLPVALAVLIADGAPSWKGEVQAKAPGIPPGHVRSPATFFVAPLVLPKICVPRYPAVAVPGAMVVVLSFSSTTLRENVDEPGLSLPEHLR